MGKLGARWMPCGKMVDAVETGRKVKGDEAWMAAGRYVDGGR